MEKKLLPNATTVMVLGILSVVLCFCYGVIGIVLGIIALVIAKKDLQMYRENPDAYENYSNLNTGRICAIVGISLGGLILVAAIMYFVFIASFIIPAISAGS